MNKLLFLILAACSAVSAQVPVTLATPPKLQFFDANGAPLAGGLVYTYACGTNSLLNTYTDSTGTAQNPDPIILDAGGFANIWLQAACFKFVIQNSSMVQQYAVDGIQSIEALVSGLASLAGNNTFTGTNIFQGPVICKNFATVRCVDANNSAGWAGNDIGGWINSAYANLPASGGEIWISQSTNNTSLSYTTPIVMATSGKYGKLRCLGASNGSFQGCTLNYVPTTGVAITFDFTPGTPPYGNYVPVNVMDSITLENNGCSTNGGCGSSAVGIDFGNTNQGVMFAALNNVNVAGFNLGINQIDTFAGWGLQFNNVSLSYNTTGLSQAGDQENTHWFGGACLANGTCATTASGSDLYIYGVSVDTNTVAGFTGTGNLYFDGHFENLSSALNPSGSAAVNYVNFTGGFVNLRGEALDDNATGTVAQMFTFVSGHVDEDVYSVGQTITNLFNVPASGGSLDGNVFTSSPMLITNTCPQAINCTNLSETINGGVPTFNMLGIGGATPTANGLPNQTDCYHDPTREVLMCASNSQGYYPVVPISMHEYTASQTLSDLNNGNITEMFCSSSCAATLPASALLGQQFNIVSTGSTLATVNLNGHTWNGLSSLTLTPFQMVSGIFDNTNFIGSAPIAAGAGIAVTPTSASLSIASNTKAGTCILGTSCAVTFGTAFNSTPVCTANDTTAANAVKVVASTSGVTLTGTSTDSIAYVCVGNPN